MLGSASETTTGFSPHGMPGVGRRLTDKILAAFNHAYAAGDTDVARRLHAALSLAAEHERHLRHSADGAERRGIDAVDQARLWVAYVEERNCYQAACRSDGEGSDEAKAAFEAMKHAYRRWSAG